MKILCLFLGKTTEKYLEQGIADFHQRLSRYCEVSIKIIKERKGKIADQARIMEEGRLLLGEVPAGSFTVALDPLGKELTSELFAAHLQQWQLQNRKGMCFIAGGPCGLSAEVRQSADLVLSLSQMTFTHEMVRLILFEQIYRAFSILAGTKYHK